MMTRGWPHRVEWEYMSDSGVLVHMARLRSIAGACVVFALALSAACGGASGGGTSTGPTGSTGPNLPPGTPSGPFVFRASPIAVDAIRVITPLGNLNPPDHTVPTDHIYFYVAIPDAGESPAARRTAFVAPADGTVTSLYTSSGTTDVKVVVRATTTVSYYLDHLIPEISLVPGTKVTAGQRLGTSGAAYAVDLGVMNDTVRLMGFVNPSRYPPDTLQAEAPLKYFEEPLRSQLYAKVQRIGPDLDGKIDFDIPGRLSGNWFGQGDNIPLAFAYDTFDPGQVRIAVAGLPRSGFYISLVFAIAAGDPFPRDVSVASGKVRYTLTNSRTGPPLGGTPSTRLLVQMLDEGRIRAEGFLYPSTADDFTSAAKTYVR